MAEFDPRTDYYAVLGVPETASARDITKAWHQLAARYHPDKHQGHDLEDLARDKLMQINEAHRILSDEKLRSAYDEARRNSSFSGQSSRPAPADYGRPASGPSAILRQLLYLAVGIVGLFLSLRGGIRTGLVFALVFAIMWFGPRILKSFRRK